MVLNDLGQKIAGALRRLNEVVVVDDELIDGCLKEICNALLSADVGVAQVVRVKKNILKDLDAENAPSGICLLYTSPSPRDVEESRMPSSA